MADPVTIRLKLSDSDVQRINAAYDRMRTDIEKPITPKVKPGAGKPITEEMKYAKGSVGALRDEIKKLEKDIDHLSDSKAIAKKQDEIKKLRSEMNGLTSGKAAGGGGGLSGVIGGGFDPSAVIGSMGVAAGPAAAIGAGLAVSAKFMQAAVEKAAELDQVVRNIGSLGVQGFEQFADKAMEISKRVPQSAAQIAQGIYESISAGIAPEKASEFAELAAKGAVAGLTETSTTVDAATTVLNAYKREAGDTEEILDQMFKAVALGKLNFEQMASSLGSVIPNAAAVGVGFDAIAAASATMTSQGQSQSQAMTKLNQLLAEFQKPGAELEGLLKRAGYESGLAAIKADGLHGALRKMGDVAASDGKLLSQYTSSTEAGAAALSLAGENADKAADDLKKVRDASGSMANALEKNGGSMQNQLQMLSNKWDVILIKVGQRLMPVIEDIIDGLDGVLSAVDNIASSISGLFDGTGDVLSEVGDLGRELGGGLASALKFTSAGLVDVTGWFEKSTDKTKENTKATKDNAKAHDGAADSIKNHGKEVKQHVETVGELGERLAAAREGLQKLEKTDAKGLSKQRALIRALEKEYNSLTSTAAAAPKAIAGSLEAMNEKIQKLAEKIRKVDVTSKAFVENTKLKKELEEEIDLITSGVAEKWGNNIKAMRDDIKARSEVPMDDVQKMVTDSFKRIGDKIKKDGIKGPEAEKLQWSGSLFDPVPPGATDEMKEKIEEMRKTMTEEYVAAGEAIGEALGAGIAKGAPGLKEALKAILLMLLDYLQRMAIAATIGNAVKNFLIGGPLGLVKAMGEALLISGLIQGAKTAITGFESGGVIVGERGPEVIAPAREFSEMAGAIVDAARRSMQDAVRQLVDTQNLASRLNINSRLTADPIELRLRGRDVYAVIKLHETEVARGTVGGM